MERIIKRYGNRKLYDTHESRYVSLDELADWIRNGEEIRVLDNATSEDVSAHTLTQVISEEGRKRSRLLPSDLLHDLIRAGESAVNQGVKHIQSGVGGLVKKSLDRIAPVSKVRDEMEILRKRIEDLERTLDLVEAEAAGTEHRETALVAEIPGEGNKDMPDDDTNGAATAQRELKNN